ncbi:MAG: PKD domain-containing protein [Hymenobacter sp.]|nr:MAG: PKD domain-containing protein [Hymenobacter sp.]
MSRKWLLSTLTFVLTGGLLLLLLLRSAHQVVRARLGPLGLAVGEPLHFADSTTDAQHWYWEFGQGNVSMAQRGVFRYQHPGTYRVRLSLDGHYSRVFTVRVKPPLVRRDSTIRLLGPTVGHQDEKLTFQTFGAPAHKYAWKFGETGQIDSRDPTAFYTYAEPGTYQVQLITDVARHPLVQKIRILPRYSPFTQPADTTADDIRWRLQRIANGQQVNQQYTYLLNRYLCGKADAPVVAGSQPPTDFYSYCMNLQFDPDWVIDAVAVEASATTACTDKLVVTQHKGE